MRRHLHSLMVGLYYPAVLGTGVVLVLFRFASNPGRGAFLSDSTLGFGLLFIAFFSGSFLAISQVDPRAYSFFLFTLDLLEVVCIFFAFYFLGLLDSTGLEVPRLRGVYLTLAILSVVQACGSWRRSYNLTRSLLRIATGVIALSAAILTHVSAAINILALFAFYSFLAGYLWTFRAKGVDS